MDTMIPTGDSAASIDFLRSVAPAGPWVLTAIHPDQHGTITVTFDAPGSDSARHWIDHHNGTRNLYFQVNPPLAPLKKKASVKDVKELAYLHVDIDPKPPSADLSDAGKREFLEAEQVRIRKLLANPPEGIPTPTFIVFSGGGFQAFWRLQEPLPINGDPVAADKAKQYNRALALAFGGDSCHDVCRIMRLPGTVNIPDAKKRAKGRRPTLAHVVDFNGNAYPISMFRPAPVIPAHRPTMSSTLNCLDRFFLPAKLKLIIETGTDPDDMSRWDGDRSDAVFYVACELVRRGVPRELSEAILLNPDLGISAHVLEQSRVEEYARRQVDRALEENHDADLEAMNGLHFCVNDDGGKARVAFYREREDKTQELATQSYEDFKKTYAHRFISIDDNGSQKQVNLGVWWLRHPARRQYDRIVFAPNSTDLPPHHFNLWRGFAVEPTMGEIPLIREHLRENISGGSEPEFRYLWNWMAWKVQNPGKPCEVAIVMRGGRGTGKSTVGHIMRRLFGPHGRVVASSEQFTGRFNGHLQACAFLFADEAVAPDDKNAESTLKAYVTEHILALEKKGVDVVQMPNSMGIMLATNDERAVPAGLDERRFAVFNVNRRRDPEWFAALHREIDDGGLEVLLHDLQATDLGDWHPRHDVPQNAALADQKARSLGVVEGAVLAMLESGEPPDGSVFVVDGRLMLSGQEFISSLGPTMKTKRRENALQHLLVKALGIERTTTRYTLRLPRHPDPVRRRGYVLPPLTELRDRWTRAMNMSVEWDEMKDWDLAHVDRAADDEAHPF